MPLRPSPSNAARFPARCSTPTGLALPGATVVVTNTDTGFTREATTADTGAYSVPNLEPGTYDVAVTMAGFGGGLAHRHGAGARPAVTLELKVSVGGVEEKLVVTGEAPLVERTSNQIGGSLSRREIEEVPSNFRNFTGLTQLIPGMTPNPATSTFEGGQVVANGSPSQQNVYLLDGMYNNDDRLGGSQGTQVRVVLDNIEEYQVLANQYSSEYGGGAGAIINMVTRGGTNDFDGRAYSYFRDETSTPATCSCPTAAQASRADAAGRVRPRRPDRPEPRPLLLHLRARQRGHRRPEELPGGGGAAGGEPGRRLHRPRQQLLRPRRPAAERPQLHQRPLAARGRRVARRGLQHQ